MAQRRAAGRSDGHGAGVRFSPWNLLLVVPFWILFTPLFNRESPVLFGMPFFYWFQFVGIAVGVLCTSLVHVKTRDRTPKVPPGREHGGGQG